MSRWKCTVCSYVYDEDQGEPATGTPPGTRFEDLPQDWKCPICQAGKGAFERVVEEDVHAGAGTTVSDVIVSVLQKWGIDCVFGIPGTSSLGLVDAVRRREDMRYIVMRHEGNAAMAASAFNKLTGRMAVCLTIAGPGATNLSTGLYDAKEDRASVLSLNGQVRYQYSGPGGAQEIDQDAFFRPVTVYNNTVYDKTMTLKLLTMALKHAELRKGVAQLSVPNNVQKEPLEARECISESRLTDLNILPEEGRLEEAAELIDRAERPVLVAGWGAYTHGDLVLQLSHRLKAPIVTTWRAKGIIPEEGENLAGIHGNVGPPFVKDLVEESDLMITLGVGFSQQTDLPRSKSIVQVDIDPMRIGKYPTDVGLWGNCGLVIPRLLERVREREDDSMMERMRREKEAWNQQLEEEADVHAGPIRPPYIMKVLSQAIPEDGVITIDVGENGWWFGRNFRMKRQRFAMSGYLGTMGFGFPAALAAKLAYPDKEVFCITGDGGFSMAMADLVTAVKYDLPVTVVVLDNRELGMIRVEQKMEGYPNFGTDLLNPDFARYAEACGATGIRVDGPKELGPALETARDTEGTVLLDVNTDPVRF
ncbi:MAG: thiamine pyrophosphate-dependent enzyme [Methanomassiliicoccales archaeon]